jgi:hypothetical protein
MKRPHFLALACVTLAAAACPGLHAQEGPRTAEEILRLVRLSYALQDHKMQGRLRDETSGRVEPMELTMSQQVIRFRFVNAPPEIVHLDLSTTPATLWQVKPGGSSRVPMSNAAQEVRGMDLNYEDLSLRFLYWTNAKLMGEDRVSTVKCWRVRVTAPNRNGPYGTVDLWVHQESGGIAKMEAWSVQGKMVKRFQVTKVQKVGKATVLKEMRIESFNPLNGDRKGRTYMTLDNPQKN